MKMRRHYNKLIGSTLLALGVVFTVLFMAIPAKAEESQILTPTITYDEASHETYIDEKRAEGYLYGGLFDASVAEDGTVELAELTKEKAIKNPVDGTEYVVKLVPEGVLDIKGQVSGALLQTETYSGSSIRMITAVDSLTYKEIGFSIKRADNGAELVKDGSVTKYVYTELYAVDATNKDGGAITYTPQDIHADANYFKTYTITGVPTEAYNTDLEVVPYWVTADGIKVEGTKSIKTVNLGRSWVYVNANAEDANGIGTYSDPFKTIQDAVDYSYEVQPEETQVVLAPHVILKSDVALGSDGAVNIEKSLTIRSEDSSRSASEEATDIRKVTTTDAFPHANMFYIKAGTVNAEKITLDGEADGTATKRRAIQLENATLNMDTVTVKNFYCNDYAGGINASAGTLYLKDTTIENCKTTKSGGSVYLQSASTMTIDGGTIDGGHAAGTPFASKKGLGGNIYAKGGSTVTILDGTVQNGTVGGDAWEETTDGVTTSGTTTGSGGNIYLEKEATDNTLDIQGGTITAGEAVSEGGNICAYGTVTMSGGTISNGVTSGNGGNLFMDQFTASKVTYNRTLTMTGGKIEGGEATGNGGSIYFGPNAALGVNGPTITGGQAVNGGAIYMRRGNLTVTSGKISGGGVDANGNVVTQKGGNVYVQTGSMTVNGGTVSGGKAVVSGGNVWTARNVTVSKGAISGGEVTGTGTNQGLGGNVCVEDTSARTLTVKESGTISGGKASVKGGNVYLIARGKLAVSGGTISGGTAPNGGSVYLPADSTMEVSNGTVSGGITTGSGGNIYADKGSTLTIKGGTIKDGNASTRGGNIHVLNTTLTMSGGTVEGGISPVGGNINGWTGSRLTITGGTIQNGTATERGGNIVATAGASSITNATINGGAMSGTSKGGGSIFVGGSVTLTIGEGTTITGGAAQKGGAIYVESGTLNITGGTITGGGVDKEGALVSKTGGNIYICADKTVNISGGTISAGKATTGGNIYVPKNATLNVSGGTISDGGVNGETVVTADGGNIWCTGNLTISGGTITGGQVTNNGGNVFYDNTTDGAVLSMTDGTISLGEAKVGGNIYVANKCEMTMSGGSITEGYASTNGGNINLHSQGTLEVSGSAVISKGEAVTRGGDISALGSVTLKDNAVIGDAETESKVTGTGSNQGLGGNIYIASYMSNGELVTLSTLTMTGGTIQNGNATIGGGCVYAKDQAVIDMQGGLITSGTTQGAGGNVWTNSELTMTQADESVTTQITDGIAEVGTSNSAGIGGNIYIDGGTLNVTSATISGGESKLSRAGNIYMHRAATLNLNSGGVIADGTSKENGGNIMVNTNTGVINVNGGTIRDGESTNAEGGNVRFGGKTFTINSGVISGGTAKTNGGNITVGRNTLTVKGGEITGGTAATGGNVYVYADTSLDMQDGTISGGVATGNGGNLYLAGTATMTKGTISGGGVNAEGEIVTSNGGNIYATGNFTMSNGTISGGKANSYGGNIYTDAVFTMEDGTISGGQVGKDSNGAVIVEASGGGNIYVVGTDASMTMVNGTIKDGTAVDRGGNICVWNRASLDIQGGEVLDGEVQVRGGNICALGDLTIGAATISGGKAWRDAVEGVEATEGTEAVEAISEAGRGGNIYIMPYGATPSGVEKDSAGTPYEKEYTGFDFTITDGIIKAGVAKISGGNIHAAGVDEVVETQFVEGTTEETGALVAVEKRNAAYIVMNLNGATIADGKAYDQGGNVWVNDCVTLTLSGKNTITGGIAYVVAEDENADGTFTTVTTPYASNLYLSGETGTITIAADFETESSIGISVAGGREGTVITGVTDSNKDLFVLENVDNKEFTYDSANGTLSITLNEPLAYTFTPIWSGGTTSVPTGLTNFSNKKYQLNTSTASGLEPAEGVAKRRLMSAAHRGDMVNYPENSAEAFQSAIALGADIVELDIHLTKDGELVLWHDSYSEDTNGDGVKEVITGELNSKKCNIDEVFEKYPNLAKEKNESKLIKDWTANELRTYIRLKCGKKQTTYFIPTFEEVLSICKGKVFIMLDIRTDATRTAVQSLVENTYKNDSAVHQSILLQTLYPGITTAEVKSKISSLNAPFMLGVTSVKFTDGVANITPAALGEELASKTSHITSNSLPKILRCGEYYEDYDSQYANYKADYRIFIETLTANDNRETWKKLDNNGYGYGIIHTNDIEGLTDYITDTWYK